MKKFSVSISQRKDGRFALEYRNPITGKRKRHLFSSREEAEDEEERLIAKYGVKKLSKYADSTVAELVPIHLARCPDSHLLDRKKNFKSFYETFKNAKVADIEKQHMQDWFAAEKKRGDYSDRTLSSIKSHLNHFFRYLVDQEIIPESPLDKFKISRNVEPKRARVYLSEHEILQILAEAKEFSPDGLFLLIYVLAHTGARRSEIFNLEWPSIDLENGLMHFLKTKNGKPRTIHMSPRLVELLRPRERRTGPAFPNPNTGKKFNSGTISRLLAAFRKKYPQKKPWGLHAFRHSFAYAFLKKGGKLYQLQALLGHSSIQMTVDVYGKLRSEDVASPSPFSF